jgi:hypothetical protein
MWSELIVGSLLVKQIYLIIVNLGLVYFLYYINLCHNSIFTSGIFLGVDTRNELAQAEPGSTQKRLKYIKRFSEHSSGHIA